MSALALMVCDTKAKTMSIFGYLIFERASRPIRFAQPRFVIVSSAIVQKCTICMRLRYSNECVGVWICYFLYLILVIIRIIVQHLSKTSAILFHFTTFFKTINKKVKVFL